LVKSKTLDAKALQNKIGNITAMVQIGSVGGALIAFIACDKIGKLAKGLLSMKMFSDMAP
jgi:galactitol-specific phosphotransferase system IIC component